MKPLHQPAISRVQKTAATVLCLTTLACTTDLGTGSGPTTSAEGDLIFLGVQSAAPSIPAATFAADPANDRTFRATHSDGFNTQFLEIFVPAGGVTTNGPVTLTVSASAARYEATVTPTVSFNSTPRTTLRFTFAVYGDLSAADASPTYASRAALAAALAIWQDIGGGLWQHVSGSTHPHADAVEAAILETGRYAAAAPR